MRRVARFAGLKRLAVTVLCAPWVGRLAGRVWRDRIPSRGTVIDVRGLSVRPEIKALLLWGLYESAEYRFVRDHLRPDLDVIELGSGLGAVSTQIARRLDGGRKLVCVEAAPRLFDKLKQNLAANPARCEVVTVQGALSHAGPERVPFEVNAWHLGSRLAPETAGDRRDVVELIEVPAWTLEQLWREHLGAGDYQLVLDVEGAEAGLFERETGVLTSCRRLLIECHPTRFAGRSYGVESLIERIREHGFELADRYGPVCFFTRAD